jgi:hypothetical protein
MNFIHANEIDPIYEKWWMNFMHYGWKMNVHKWISSINDDVMMMLETMNYHMNYFNQIT